MKFTKTLIAAAMLTGAGAAQAAITVNDAVLSIFDYTNGKSYSIDTGVSFASLDPNYLPNGSITGDGSATDAQQQAYMPSLAGLNLTISNDANLASLINAEGAHDSIYWTINGSDSNDLVSTFTTTTKAADISAALQLTGTAAYFASSATLINAEIGDQGSAAGSANSLFQGSSSYANAAHYGLNLNNNEGSLVNAAQVGTNLNLWAVYASAAGDNLTNNYGALSLTLGTTAGSATLAVVPTTVSSVPLPTTAWMFLSGVIGLLASKRRKNSAV
jgi:hypothetical protein